MTVPNVPPPQRSAAPTVVYGPGSVRQAPDLVARLGAERVLLVCGKRSFGASGAAAILPDLERVATVRRWSDFAPNTDHADLVVGLAIAQEFEPDLILAVGGGSAMDMAKLLVGYSDLAPGEVATAIVAGRRGDRRKARLILAPTTSGSGAEATHFAVVYIGDDKNSIAGDAMRPDAIVLDPLLTLSGSAYQRATSGIDAVAQAIESLWATGATDRSRRFARHALRHLLPAIEAYVNQPGERSARAMAIGSHLAGRAIDISKTTAAHALSYGLTKRHGVSHGHAVALTLGGFIERHADASVDDLQPGVTPAAHREAMSTVLHALDANSGTEGRHTFTALIERLGLTPTLSQAGIAASDREHLADTINVERLASNPVTFDRQALVALLHDNG